MTTIADFCRAHGITDKVIAEMCKLDGDDAAKRRVCEIALEAKPGFLKTSTGRSFGGAKLEDVRLMHEVLGDAVAIKAAGGIHNYEEACAFIEAGASALGASAGIAIVEGAPTDEPPLADVFDLSDKASRPHAVHVRDNMTFCPL